MTIKPLCFIAMPFGRKVVDGRSVEFDIVWQEVIASTCSCRIAPRATGPQ